MAQSLETIRVRRLSDDVETIINKCDFNADLHESLESEPIETPVEEAPSETLVEEAPAETPVEEAPSETPADTQPAEDGENDGVQSHQNDNAADASADAPADTQPAETGSNDNTESDPPVEADADAVRTAVLSLKSDNPAHWNSGGSPNVNAVTELLGAGFRTSRKVIDSVASDVTRETIDGINSGS